MTDDADTEAVPVEYEVTGVDRIARGDIIALATVRITINGIPIDLQGVRVRQKPGGLLVEEPAFRCARSAAWYPAIILPDEVWRAVATEVAAVVSGRKVREIAEAA